MPRHPNSSPQTLRVLAALLAAPDGWVHGYALAQVTGLASGTLYPILRRLTAQGWLEGEWRPSPDTGRPARQLHRLTRDASRARAPVRGRAAVSRPTIADRLCALIERATLAAAPPSGRDWLRALHAEAQAVPRGWRRVRWLAGSAGFVLALHLETQMLASPDRPRMKVVARNAAPVALFTALMLTVPRLMKDAARRGGMSLDESDAFVLWPITAVILVGFGAAVALRARWATIASIGLLVMAVNELLMRDLLLGFGGWHAHITPLVAGTLAAAMVLVPRVRRLLARAGRGWPLLTTLLAFAMAEAFAWSTSLGGVGPFRTPWVHAIVACAAALGTALALTVRARVDESDAEVAMQRASR